MMKNITSHVLLSTLKPCREHINLLRVGGLDDVTVRSVLKGYIPTLQNTVGLDVMGCCCDRCLVSSQPTAVFCSSNSLKPGRGHLVSLNRFASHCNLPHFVASRQSNWRNQLKSAYCLAIVLAHSTALQGREEQRMFIFTWVKLKPVILEQIMLFIKIHLNCKQLAVFFFFYIERFVFMYLFVTLNKANKQYKEYKLKGISGFSFTLQHYFSFYLTRFIFFFTESKTWW